MAVKLEKKHFQTKIYDYVWNRDAGDAPYSGVIDRQRVDKDEGYEVLYLIKTIMDKHDLKKVSDVHRIEDALHDPELSGLVMRNNLISKIEEILGLDV
ncbi:conserved hypothetical protein [uncultured Thiomicrorhabdus sp.]